MQEDRHQFSNIQFQRDAIESLLSSAKCGRRIQTYLFSGSKSCGKTKTALAFAAFMQCENNSDLLNANDSCGFCDSCRRIASGAHPDVSIVSPKGFEIRVEQVRQMQDEAVLTPSMGRWRIFIIEPAQRLNVFSANSLLKIFEDAPSYALFILVTEKLEAVLPTIVSRSQVVKFRSPSHNEVRETLTEVYSFDSEKSNLCYSLSEGRFGEALLLSGQYCKPLNIAGLGESQKQYISSIEVFAADIQAMISASNSLDMAMNRLSLLDSDTNLFYRYARKAFCKALIMSYKIPAAFSIMFTTLLLKAIDKASDSIKRTFSSFISDVSDSYKPAFLKELESTVSSGLSAWRNRQIEGFIFVLHNYLEDVLRYQYSKNESLLLNLSDKKDIMTLSEFYSSSFCESRLELLEKSIHLLGRHVQPALILENLVTQIGGTEV